MKNLSKTKLLAFRQCPKRLWLEIHRPELREDSATTKASFATGNTVGALARKLYDPRGRGSLIDPKSEGFEQALQRTSKLLDSRTPIFEAGFAAGGALAFADVLLPVKSGGKAAWRMVEIKSGTKVHDYYRDDAAIQHFVATQAGVRLSAISLAHIDSKWVYRGGDDYAGILVENDLTRAASEQAGDVRAWIAAARRIAGERKEPEITTGSHCTKPYACGFSGYCSAQEPPAKHPVQWLPNVRTKVLKAHLANEKVRDMRDVPDALLNPQQLRVKQHTLSGKTYFDPVGARAALSWGLPAYFLDFETIQFAVPIWKGTRPYQNIPFQFSCHRLSRTGKLEHQMFLDLSGQDPSWGCADALLAACGESGPIFVFNASFEATCIRMLADFFPKKATALRTLRDRLVDLNPIAEKFYYHPDQNGSWGLKSVLPNIASDLRYEALDGVKSGGGAMLAYSEAVHVGTTAYRRAEIERQLSEYCAIDTLALVRLWQKFSGRSSLKDSARL